MEFYLDWSIDALKTSHLRDPKTRRKMAEHFRLPETEKEMEERKRHLEEHCEKRH